MTPLVSVGGIHDSVTESLVTAVLVSPPITPGTSSSNKMARIEEEVLPSLLITFTLQRRSRVGSEMTGMQVLIYNTKIILCIIIVPSDLL